LEHLRIVYEKDIVFPSRCRELYDSIMLIHQGFPGIDYDEVDLRFRFLGYQLSAPIMITGMTGGHRDLIDINGSLAKLAEEYRIAIGVGSQRPILVKPSSDVIESYRVVRKYAANVPVIGNIGANTLQDYDVKDIVRLVEIINADALAIHLNPAQEIIHPEGDTRFDEKVLDKVNELIDRLDKPVIIKEVGNGLSMETVKKFRSIGIRYFDVSGACGTNWILVEKYRSSSPIKRIIADELSNWGIPTPLAVIEARYTAPDSIIIASGGVWDGIKAVKNLVLGADMVGFARPVLVNLLEGYDKAREYIERYIMEMKTVMFLIGAKNLEQLHRKPVILLNNIKDYMIQRGIDPEVYNEVRTRK
jgi:isopentenyl-diphosphate delta-isomerase